MLGLNSEVDLGSLLILTWSSVTFFFGCESLWDWNNAELEPYPPRDMEKISPSSEREAWPRPGTEETRVPTNACPFCEGPGKLSDEIRLVYCGCKNLAYHQTCANNLASEYGVWIAGCGTCKYSLYYKDSGKWIRRLGVFFRAVLVLLVVSTVTQMLATPYIPGFSHHDFLSKTLATSFIILCLLILLLTLKITLDVLYKLVVGIFFGFLLHPIATITRSYKSKSV